MQHSFLFVRSSLTSHYVLFSLPTIPNLAFICVVEWFKYRAMEAVHQARTQEFFPEEEAEIDQIKSNHSLA